MMRLALAMALKDVRLTLFRSAGLVQALLLGLKDGRVSRHDLERSAVRILRMIRKNTVLKSK